MPAPRRTFCSDVSRADDEPLAATASIVDRWLLIEYRGLWAHDAIDASTLSAAAKRAVVAWRNAVPHSRVLFVRRPERRGAAGLVVFRADTPEHGGSLRRLELERHDELAAVDLDHAGEAVDHPLLLVCTHGKHDPCCARFGRPLYEALREEVEADWVWQSSHVGGDRFAANLVALPSGLFFGRVEPSESWTVVDELLAGRIPLDRYRGRSCHAFPVQAAERAVRETTGLVGVDDLELVASVAEDDGRWRVRYRRRGSQVEWETLVERRHGPLTHLTCSAEALRHPRHYVAGSPPARVA
jgi:hypothetical protein